LSQVWPNNFQNYDGTVRSSLFRSYGHMLTVPFENVIVLGDDEVERVEEFAQRNSLTGGGHRVLFECSARSGQSFMTPAKAQEVAAALYELVSDARVVLSTHLPVELRDARSVYAGALSLREIAHLTHHVDLFVGAGSGGTVAASSTASRVVPMVQLLSESTSVYASFAHDFSYFGQDHRPVIESTNEDPATIARAVAAVLRDGVSAAIAEFQAPLPIRFDHYFNQIGSHLLASYRFFDAARSLLVTAERYGWTRDLLNFAQAHVVPFLRHDESWFFKPSREIAERLLDEITDAGEGLEEARLGRHYADGSAYLKPALSA
jgi:hypothetical protein